MPHDPRTGAELLSDIQNLEITRKPIVEEFIYERDIILMSADSGVGKSTIVAQMAMSLSSGTPLFGALNTRKVKVYVIQVEGDYEESIERIRFMSKVLPFDADYLCWDENRMLDVSNKDGINMAIDRIKSKMEKPDVIFIDPIYKLSTKDISTGEGALMIVNFSDRLYDYFGSTNFLVHHNTKDDFTIVDGKAQKKKDSYYGHSFIKNHVRTSYSLTQNDSKDQPTLTRKKGRGSDTLHKIELIYNPVTMTCELAREDKNFDALARINRFLDSKKIMGKTTNFNETMESCFVSQAQLRRLKHNVENRLEITKDKFGKELWKII